MKDTNGFDELARRKLAERRFAFDETHWADMEQLLNERARKPKMWWPWTVAGVLLLGAGALWLGTEQEAPSATGTNVAIVEPAASQADADIHLLSENAAPTSEPIPSTTTGKSHAESERVVEPKNTSMSVAPTTKGTRSVLKSSAPSVLPQARANGASRTAEETTMPVRTAQHNGTNEEPAAVITTSTTIAVSASGNIASSHPSEATGTTDPVASPTVPTMIEPTARTGSEATTPAPASAIAEPIDVTSAQEPPAVPTTPNTDVAATSNEASAPEAPSAPATAPPPPSTWLAVRTPFELTALGGMFSTSSVYSGRGTEDWNASVDRQNTTGFGLEGVWNLTDHFALGMGAHYGSYRERLHTAESVSTDRVLTNNYFWVPYDTMVLTVIGTDTIGATIYNITELVPTTLYDLEHTTDTTYTATVLRKARTMTNTVSYLEIPLLLDAHTSRGRWVFGVRGGPSLGLVTSRQGTVPGDGEAGFTALDDRTFRSLTLGCSARAYVRYRLSSTWSIGVEPTWRQQLGNAFNDGTVQRRANALGVYLSLSYRFAPKSVVH